MRIQSWAKRLDQKATLDAYLKAKTDGATALALRIRFANNKINAGDDDLSAEFDAIDANFNRLPVSEA